MRVCTVAVATAHWMLNVLVTRTQLLSLLFPSARTVLELNINGYRRESKQFPRGTSVYDQRSVSELVSRKREDLQEKNTRTS